MRDWRSRVKAWGRREDAEERHIEELIELLEELIDEEVRRSTTFECPNCQNPMVYFYNCPECFPGEE